MKFGYTLDGQEVVIDVLYYQPYCPMRITGSGFGDAEPPEEEEFEFEVLGTDGLPWPAMQDKVDPAEEKRILAFYLKLRSEQCQSI